jgi:iron complex outermembrane receptor protein
MTTNGRWATAAACVLLFAATVSAAPVSAGAAQAADLDAMSIEDLGNIEVTSVSKRGESLKHAAAAIYVITAEDIRRSGATSIPEMLRLAPNLQVARIGASRYSITARGFGTDSPNKLLVLIDGRSIYSPLHAAVFWDAQDVPPQDIERIEVISGPGGTLWGANAVNGVINIITKSAADTVGVSASAGVGTEERNISAQYGAAVGENAAARVYLKGFDRLRDRNAAHMSLRDGWDGIQGGFRFDWKADGDSITAQGDLNRSGFDAISAKVDGETLGLDWRRLLDGGSSFEVRASYDRALRSIPGSIGDETRTYDLEAQHSFRMGRSDVVWGGGYRVADGAFTNIATIFITPPARVLKWANVFAQDTLTITDTVHLTAGLKYEHSSYTGGSFLPSGRLSWAPVESFMVWSAVSRAVRAPSRLDRDYNQNIGTVRLLVPGDFHSEKLTAYEAGFKGTLGPRIAYSVAGYYNDYTDLRSVELTPTNGLPAVFANMMEGETHGIEAWATYTATDWWRVTAGVSALAKDLRLKPGSHDLLNGVKAAGNDPDHSFSLRSSITLPAGFELDAGVRTVTSLPNPAVPAYAAVDARLGWRIAGHWDLSLTATNALDNVHPEFGALPNRAQFGRAVYFSVGWRS